MLPSLVKRSKGATTRIIVATVLAIVVAVLFSPSREFIQFDNTLSRIGMSYIHGSLGFTIVVLAIIQVTTGVKFRKFSTVRTMHRFQGHLLYSFIIIQTVVGIFGR